MLTVPPGAVRKTRPADALTPSAWIAPPVLPASA